MRIREITSDLVRMRLSRVLRKHIGRGLTFRDDREVSALIDVDDRTITSWRMGDRAPQAEGLLRLFMLPEAGAEVATEVLAIAGMSAQAIEGGNPCPFHANAEIVGALRELSVMLEDGRIDHMEDPVWQSKAIELGCKLIAHANARRMAAGGR